MSTPLSQPLPYPDRPILKWSLRLLILFYRLSPAARKSVDTELLGKG